ncbi:hypothetical protein K469DRAFT_689898 [Zopfia rhizophila CBS 207.26]|uniref:Cytochrome b5 heme-binding domain-containing protein n=1 Tax=Zopfia rhizophila CBS 207.26 TaxID=1314779 RepID=A0A6A6DW20_9PEZI|nr:hypothetical protein K469DRAFT_689898 [Zopfia rhizophila CBS 207.26]
MAAHNRNPSTPATSSSSEPDTRPKSSKDSSDGDAGIGGLSVLDLLRVLGGILLLSCGMSYLSTSGQSLTWGYNPWWTRTREWKALIKGQVYLTDEQLRAYDGTDPRKPIYLALNGTIYDVSASPQTYGPGGSYHFFAGRDAARAFLTGCFQEDQTPDLRGVEMMYMPVDAPVDSKAPDSQPQSYDPVEGKPTDTPDVEAHKKARSQDKRRKPLTKGEIKNRHAQELRQARKKVREGLEHWHKLFRGDKDKPYFKVGEVKREPGWLDKVPRRKLCEHAEQSRPKREE